MMSRNRQRWNVIFAVLLIALCLVPILKIQLPEKTQQMGIAAIRISEDLEYDADKLLKAEKYVLEPSRIEIAGMLALICFLVMAVTAVISLKKAGKWSVVSFFAFAAGAILLAYSVIAFSNLPVAETSCALSVSPVIYVAVAVILIAACNYYVQGPSTQKTIIYLICCLLIVLSVLPFWIMVVNSTRSTSQINQGISLLPSTYLKYNWDTLSKFSFDAVKGFTNSLIIAVSSTVLCLYFSALTAYGFVAYRFRGSRLIFSIIIGSMMIPGLVGSIGYYQAVYRIGLIDSYWPLILPSIASSGTVFFFRQYLEANYQCELTEAARVDGSGEWHTFNTIIFPIMKPVLAISGISSFVGSWNNYFTPLMILNDPDKMTIPLMVQQMTGNDYRTEYGSLYLGLTMASIPLFIVYGLLSRYIVKGVALGAVKG